MVPENRLEIMQQLHVNFARAKEKASFFTNTEHTLSNVIFGSDQTGPCLCVDALPYLHPTFWL